MRAAQREKLALREEILRIRAEREQIALRMDAARIKHEEDSKEALVSPRRESHLLHPSEKTFLTGTNSTT